MKMRGWVLGVGFWGLGFGGWVLGVGFWGLGFRGWVLGVGLWGLGLGGWVLGNVSILQDKPEIIKSSKHRK